VNAFASHVTRGLESLLTPADTVRRSLLGLFGSSVARLHRDRRFRIALGSSVGVFASLALTLLAPLTMLTLSPLVLGVPHLLADVRYLVARPKLHRRPWLLAAIAVPLMALALRPEPSTGLCAALFAVLLSRAAWLRKLCTAAAVLAVIAATRYTPDAPWTSALLISHLHNLVAIGIAFLVFAPKARDGAIPTVLYLALSALLLFGALDPILFRSTALSTGWLDATAAAAQYAPAETDARLAFRLLAWFVFSQSVHYTLWLRAIPDAARESKATRGFRSSLRALTADVGLPLVLLALVLWLGLLGYAMLGPEAARITYLGIAFFHGYMEFAILALAIAEPGFGLAARRLR
jgi:hypothetical protein